MRLQPGIIIVPSKSAPVVVAPVLFVCLFVVVSPARLRFRSRSHF